MFKVVNKVEGEYTLVRRNAKTLEAIETIGPFKNLITDIGLDRLSEGTQRLVTSMYVGTGTTPPTTATTNMQARVATSTLIQSSVQTTEATSPYRQQDIRVHRFNPGVATGNLTEVGIGWTTDSINGVFSRALIVDSQGDPVAITVLADEVLDVTYTLSYYPPLVDSSVVVNIPVDGVESLHTFASRIFGAAPAQLNMGAFQQYEFVNLWRAGATLGPIGSGMVGSILTSGLVASGVPTYVPGSFEYRRTMTIQLNEGNDAGGIGGITLNSNGNPAFSTLNHQITVTPPIMKTSEEILNLTFIKVWSRAT